MSESSKSAKKGRFLFRTDDLRILGPLTVDQFLAGLAEKRFTDVTDACASLDSWFSLSDKADVLAHLGHDCWRKLQPSGTGPVSDDEDATPTDPRIVRPAVFAEASRPASSGASASQGMTGTAARPTLPRPQTLSPPASSLGTAWFLRLTLFVLGLAMSTVVYLVFRLLRPEE